MISSDRKALALIGALCIAGQVSSSAPAGLAGFQDSPAFQERTALFTLEPEVKVLVNAPSTAAFDKNKKVMLILYALPNGNTIEQTIGHKLQPGDDWHFDIQHIGAQTRFLRQLLPDRNIVVACLEANAQDLARYAALCQELCQWLEAPGGHRLCVLAYDDATALLNGKPFVSAEGGTWGRSHAMIKDIGARFTLTRETNAPLERVSALDGRITFLLTENPERKILHTVQVERNGFIEAMVSGTTNEGRGYTYFGERAYGKWIPGK